MPKHAAVVFVVLVTLAACDNGPVQPKRTLQSIFKGSGVREGAAPNANAHGGGKLPGVSPGELYEFTAIATVKGGSGWPTISITFYDASGLPLPGEPIVRQLTPQPPYQVGQSIALTVDSLPVTVGTVSIGFEFFVQGAADGIDVQFDQTEIDRIVYL